MMGSVFCDDCNLERSIVYCNTHLAKFCFHCDRKLHPILSLDDQDHSRFPLCNNCFSQIARFQCPNGSCLCQKCFIGRSIRSNIDNVLCNDSNKISDHTDLDLDSLSPTSHFDGESSQSSRFFRNFDNYTENHSNQHDYIDIPKDSFEGNETAFKLNKNVLSEDLFITEAIDELTKHISETPIEENRLIFPGNRGGHGHRLFGSSLPSSPLDMSSVTHKDYNTETLDHASSQYYNNNQMVVSKAKEETNNHGMFPKALVQFNCEPSQLILPDEILLWEDQTQASRFIPQERQDILKRYFAKKKKRKFGKQIRYESRKSTADTKRRMKGRFTKANAEYDYDPRANKINK